VTGWHIVAELRKIALRPVTLLLFAVLGLGCVTTAFYAQDYWFHTVHDAQRGLDGTESGASYRSCVENNPRLGAEYCQRTGRGELETARAWVADSREQAVRAAQAQTVPGALGWAAQAFASFPGLLGVLVLGAYSMGTEYDTRTAGNLLLADPRVRSHILAKASALWLVTAVAMLSAGAAVAVFGQVKGAPAYPLAEFHAPLGEGLRHGLRLLGGALLVTGVWSVAVVALTAWSRGRAAGMVRAGALLVVLMLGSGVAWLWAWLPGGVVADLMAFRPGHVLWNVWWGSESGSAIPFAVRMLPSAVLTAAALVWVVRTAERRSEVT
jgi:hypothetical protein